VSGNTLDRHSYQQTRHRGFVFRYRADGGRTFYGYVPGRGRVQLQASTEHEALSEWNELRGKAGNGETIPERNVKLRDIEPAWWEIKARKLRSSTAKEYRAAVDLVHVPLFGHRRLLDIDADAISKLDHGLTERGLNYIDRTRPVRPLSRSQVDNYMKPLRSLMKYAVRHKKIPVNPFDLLTDDDRADDDRERFVYEWSDQEIANVFAKADELDRRPEARQEYAALIRAAVETGERLGELTGADWDTDLDLDAGVWNVSKQWTKYGELVDYTKTRAGIRRVPLTPEFVRYMKAFGSARRTHTPAIPFSPPSGPEGVGTVVGRA
jgi:integrase